MKAQTNNQFFTFSKGNVMTAYFNNTMDVTEIKKTFLRLVHKNHPDKGGDTATMQEINRQYAEALKGNHGKTFVGTDDKTRTYWYNSVKEQEIIDKINELFAADLSDDVEIVLIGSWIWVTGNTKPNRKALKACKMRWHSKRNAWYYHTKQSYRTHYNSKVSLNDLANAYGCEVQEKPEDDVKQVSA